MTSKPDLYPLLFTCNGDNGKNSGGSSYVMVQYFRNYIVGPVGSLSATSTVESLSSSFICPATDSMVPPPYSRAASPDLHITNNSSSGGGGGVGQTTTNPASQTHTPQLQQVSPDLSEALRLQEQRLEQALRLHGGDPRALGFPLTNHTQSQQHQSHNP